MANDIHTSQGESFQSSQYPNFEPGIAVSAVYRPSPLSAYVGNPFLEALPPIYSEEELIDLIAYDPGWNEHDRTLPAHYRVHGLERALDFIEPQPWHTEFAARFDMLLRGGLVWRNPCDRRFWQDLDKNIASLSESMALGTTKPELLAWAEKLSDTGESQPRTKRPRNSPRRQGIPRSLFLLGVSGMGKSLGVERILDLYPQVIDHREYNGRPLTVRQIAWLKLDCPHDGSLRGLAFDFFDAIDGLLGTTYFRDFAHNGRATRDEVAVRMARTCAIHGIGALIIDEIQCLCDVPTADAVRTLNFLVQLVNKLRVPIVFIGTYKVQQLFVTRVRQARRVVLRGQILCDPLTRNGEDWQLFLRALWRYQYLPTPFALTDEFSDALFEVSQGITHCVVAAYFLAQVDAIRAGCETLTVARLTKVAQEELGPLQYTLNALRTNDLMALANIEDIQPFDIRAKVRQKAQALVRNQHLREAHSMTVRNEGGAQNNTATPGSPKPNMSTEGMTAPDHEHKGVETQDDVATTATTARVTPQRQKESRSMAQAASTKGRQERGRAAKSPQGVEQRGHAKGNSKGKRTLNSHDVLRPATEFLDGDGR